MRRAPQASYPRRAPATLYASRSNSADPGDHKRRRRRRRGGGDGERIRLQRSAHGPDHGFAWLNLVPEDTTTKAKDWGNRIRARPRGEDNARGEDARCGLAVGAARGRFGVCLILLFSAPDMWVPIVGSEHAVRRYWDQETDKRGVVL